ncbi:hypothetical protein Pint_33401 [Pistacia integerrima]|uniref:Uncharacterized protein n=1 Tax=Pistacia integerrima TaxID=434235 RepID=A0ACC0X8Y5_9ROSI|nr:hypothetical protein Pint_33401 [Pistacia integerrima]
MAARSFFLSLRRTSSTIIKNNACSEGISHSRFLSSGVLASDVLEESSSSKGKDDLKTRIFRLRLPKRSVINVIKKWVTEGNQTTMFELRQIQKELRKSQRYKHALEISEWMVTHEEFALSDSDYAIRIDLMTKVFGIDAAERYFEGLPLSANTSETCTALLHSYAGAKLTEKAEKFYEIIKESNLSFNALMYNEMMTLYMSVGQVEKVALVVEDLKRKNVVPDIFTYNLWISSCAATLNMDEVRKILDEISSDSRSNDSLLNYINLVKIYIKASHLVNAEFSPLVEADKSITQREWITYDFLIILYAGLGNKLKIDQIWKSLRMTKQKMTSRNYICILSSYLMLGHLKEIEEVIDQWKQSTTSEFDISACNRLLQAFKDVGLNEKANDLHMLLLQKNSSPTNE